MTTKTMRKIVSIDEERCDGCGLCVPACAEGALQIIDGKAKLVSEIYCDGLGACLGECPQGAIIIEERQVEGFDEEAVSLHLKQQEAAREESPCGCPSAAMATFARQAESTATPEATSLMPSALGHWPVQLTLVPPSAPFLKGSDLILTADCVPFAYAGFHQRFLKGHSLLVACPKLDDFESHLAKLTEVVRRSGIKSLTVLRMEVPCCSGLTMMAGQALKLSGRDIPLREEVISIRGEIES